MTAPPDFEKTLAATLIAMAAEQLCAATFRLILSRVDTGDTA